jgi:phosphate transport system permease protein
MPVHTATETRTPPPQGRVRAFTGRLRAGDETAYLVTLLAAGTIFVITATILYQLYTQSTLSRAKFGWNFLFTQTWDPIAGNFGASTFIYGTVVTSLLALLIAVPQGLGSAIFLSELAPPMLSDALTFLIELLAAVPSVLYGLIGIFVLVPILQNYVVPVLKGTLGFLPIFEGPFYGVSYFSAGVVLSIMIVPFIVSVSREVLMAVPRDQREAALALGSTRWQTTWRVVLPFAFKGIMGSIFLALARALGETMAVTMVIGNTPQIKASLLAPGYSIAAVIANEFTEAVGALYLSSLVELGLVLFAVTFVINGLARLLILATSRQGAPT